MSKLQCALRGFFTLQLKEKLDLKTAKRKYFLGEKETAQGALVPMKFMRQMRDTSLFREVSVSVILHSFRLALICATIPNIRTLSNACQSPAHLLFYVPM